MRPAVREAMNEVIKLLLARSDPTGITSNRAVAEELGKVVANAIKARILFITEPPLAAPTRRGRGGGTPLVTPAGSLPISTGSGVMRPKSRTTDLNALPKVRWSADCG